MNVSEPSLLPQITKDQPSLRARKRGNTDMNHTQLSNPPETPTPPSDGLSNTGASGTVPQPERHQSALRHIHSLETHNAKLYEDNCRLVNAVNMLSERLALLGEPQNMQARRLADMQERLCTSEAHRARISEKYQQMMQCATSDSPNQHMVAELQAIRDAYITLDRDYHLLTDKYLRLKGVADTARVSPTRGSVPVAPPGFVNGTPSRKYDNYPVSPASVVCPGSLRISQDYSGDHRRHSSEIVIFQPPFHPSTSRMVTTRSVPLPTPPPSAPMTRGHFFPTPAHALAVTAPLALPQLVQMEHDQHISSKSSAAIPLQPPLEHGIAEQLPIATHLRQRSDKLIHSDPDSNQEQISPRHFESSPRPSKRPRMDLQTDPSPGTLFKKACIEEVYRPPTGETDASPVTVSKALVPLVSADSSNDCKLPVSHPHMDTRTDRDCVNLIFEKDADVENGVFCGLCFDRYEAKMIQEPPDILVQPELESLVMHCMTMHPTVWGDLRHTSDKAGS